MDVAERKYNLSVRMERPEALQQLTKKELYQSLRKSYQDSISGNEETVDAREVVKGLLAEV